MDDLQAKVKAEYESGMGPTALSKKHNIPLNTIKSWIRRWKQREGAPRQEGAPCTLERVHPEERGVSPPVVIHQQAQPEVMEDTRGRGLTPKQRLFVQEYIVDLNGTQAAIRAGYKPKNARVIAAQLLARLNIRQAVRQAMEDRIRRTQITADWVLDRLLAMADYNLHDFSNIVTERIAVVDEITGAPKDIEVQRVRFNEHFDGRIASGLYKGKDGIKIETPDKVKVLELIGKHLGMWQVKVEAKVEHSGTVQHEHHYDLSNFSDEELMQLEQLTRKATESRSH